MKPNVHEEQNVDEKEKGLHAKSMIDLDQPFDYEEVAAITGTEFVQNLRRDGLTVRPYEELKRDAVDLLSKAVEKRKYTNVSGFQVADDYYYHSGHSWVHLEHDGRVKIGIDDFTAKVFGPADTINLPSAGAALMQGQVGWSLIRNDHKAPMQSPISGTVLAVNDKIKKQPEITHDDPHEEGWLFLLEPSSLEMNLKELYQGKACFQWLENENQNLLELLGPEYQRLAATGGGLIDDIYGHFSEINWDQLVKTFLRTKKI